MTAESALVLALCRVPLPARALHRAAALVEDKIDWDAFFAVASAWRVSPVVLRNLREHFAGRLPDDVVSRAKERERDARAVALGRTLALTELLARFAAANIRAIVLKGPATGVTAYGDVSFRSFADLDLLVRRPQAVAARSLLVSLGYSPEYALAEEKGLLDKDHALELSRPSTKVELHVALVSRHLRFPLSDDEAWRGARTVEIAGRPVLALGQVHEFLFLCAHGTKHRWASAHWLCDIAQAASRLDDSAWDDVLLLARKLGATRLLALSLRLARDLVYLELPGSVERGLVPESDTAGLELEARWSLGVEAMPEVPPGREDDPNLVLLRYWIRARERRLDRLVSLARVAFVPTERDTGPGLVKWVTRPLRLGGHALRRLVSG